MSFSTMLELLKEKNKEKITIIKLGNFYIATGEDAVLLHKKLNLKCSCFKNNICKVGFPVNSLKKYIEKLNELKYAYTIYEMNEPKTELLQVSSKIGKKHKEIKRNINCMQCKGMEKYKEDQYLLALQKMLEKE